MAFMWTLGYSNEFLRKGQVWPDMAHQKYYFFTDALILYLSHSYLIGNILSAIAAKNIWPTFIFVVWQMVFNFLAFPPVTQTTYLQYMFLKVSKLVNCRQMCKFSEVCLSMTYIPFWYFFPDFSDLCSHNILFYL